MKAIADQTIINPKDRMYEIENNIDFKINKIPNRFKIENNDFKINLENNKVDAYQLLKPSIVLGQKSLQLKSDRINIKDLFKSQNLDNWVIIYDFKIKEIDQII